jgi:hypothetical protein
MFVTYHKNEMHGKNREKRKLKQAWLTNVFTLPSALQGQNKQSLNV